MPLMAFTLPDAIAGAVGCQPAVPKGMVMPSGWSFDRSPAAAPNIADAFIVPLIVIATPAVTFTGDAMAPSWQDRHAMEEVPGCERLLLAVE